MFCFSKPGGDGELHADCRCVPGRLDAVDWIRLEVFQPAEVTMRFIHQLLSALLLAGSLAGLAFSQNAASSENWKRYSFPEIGIEFSSPYAPTILKPVLPKRDGIERHAYAVDLGNGSHAIFTTGDLTQSQIDQIGPNEPVRTILEAAKASFLRQRPNDELVFERDVTLDGNSGIEFETKNAQVRGRSRIFLVKDKIIMALVMGPVTAPLPVEATKLLDSLRILAAIRTP